MNQYFTYILQCSDKTLYCGYTTDLEKRLATHNSGKGAKYTKTRLPVKLLASVDFDNKNDAMSCEWWFKHKEVTNWFVKLATLVVLIALTIIFIMQIVTNPWTLSVFALVICLLSYFTYRKKKA